MTAEAIIERDVIVPAVTDASRTPFSWSAAIAGTLAAMAVAFIIMALGSGIGLSFASPYGSGPSATSLTVAAAVWLVMAQTMGFATGGYLAGRLRSPAYDGVIGETTFRDAAQGFIVWALGAVAMAAFVGLIGYLAASAATQAAAGAATGVGVAAHNEPASTPAAATDYFVDLLFRPGPAPTTASTPRPSDTVGLAAAGAQPGLNAETRAEVTRILVRSIGQGRLDDNDRGYLAQVVSARTGLPPDEAQRRVAEVETKAREAVKEAADKTARPAPISRSGPSCRFCSAPRRRRLAGFWADSCATPKAGWPETSHRQTAARFTMLNFVVTLLIIALIAAVLGFGGIAGTAVELAKIVFFVALVLFVVAAVFGAIGGSRPVV